MCVEIIYYVLVFMLLCEFPLESKGAGEDASKFKWISGVNSWAALEQALAGDSSFVVGDVALGYAENVQNGWRSPVPESIMVNMMGPPDISLGQWMDVVSRRSTANKRTVVLSFKDSEALQPALQIIQRKPLKTGLWLQADILSTSANRNHISHHLDADWFLGMASKLAPEGTTLLLGWTTSHEQDSGQRDTSYSWSDVISMVNILSCHQLDRPLAFSMRASFAVRSIRQVLWLSQVVPNSLFLLWVIPDDAVRAEDLLEFRQRFPLNRVYYDLSCNPHLEQQFNSKKYEVEMLEHGELFHDGNWDIYPPNQPECQSATYVTSDSLVVTYPTPEGTIITLRSHYRTPITLSATLMPYEILNYQHYSSYVGNRFSVLVMESESFPSKLDASSVPLLLSSAAQLSFETRGMRPGQMPCNVSFVFEPVSARIDPCKVCTGCPSLCDSRVQAPLERPGCGAGMGRVLKDGTPVRLAFYFAGWRGFVLDDISVFGEQLQAPVASIRSLAIHERVNSIMLFLVFVVLQVFISETGLS